MGEPLFGDQFPALIDGLLFRKAHGGNDDSWKLCDGAGWKGELPHVFHFISEQFNDTVEGTDGRLVITPLEHQA
jgi:hypothetical protein